MLTGYTVFFTYGFETVPYISGTSLGYSQSIHSNYIKKIKYDNLINKTLSFYFENPEEFSHLNSLSGSTYVGTGWTANKIYSIIQIVDNSDYSSESEIKPIANGWKKFDLTDQLDSFVSGTTHTITKTDLTEQLFTINLNRYGLGETYTLEYLNYPTNLQADSNKLAFGEEVYFFGNVSTDIEAIPFTTEIPIQLPLTEFNSTTNKTWDGVSSVQITEVGIYDSENNLVAIGKLNNPISKDSTIARTILFAIDF